jgi:hypothetical protein
MPQESQSQQRSRSLTAKASPSRAASDAVHVRTDGNSFEETVSAVEAVVRRAISATGTRP